MIGRMGARPSSHMDLRPYHFSHLLWYGRMAWSTRLSPWLLCPGGVRGAGGEARLCGRGGQWWSVVVNGGQWWSVVVVAKGGQWWSAVSDQW